MRIQIRKQIRDAKELVPFTKDGTTIYRDDPVLFLARWQGDDLQAEFFGEWYTVIGTDFDFRYTTDELVRIAIEQGYRHDRRTYEKLLGHGGDYYWNVYVRAYAKALRAQAEQEQAEFDKREDALLTILFDATQLLKTEYLDQMDCWARREFSRCEQTQYPSYRVIKEQFPRQPLKYFRQAVNAYQRAKKIVDAGLQAFRDKQRALATAHYEDSIRKLALRVAKKGLNQKALRVETGRVGVNIETTLTDGEKTVRAWTIVASGPIIRPHYRYLIK